MSLRAIAAAVAAGLVFVSASVFADQANIDVIDTFDNPEALHLVSDPVPGKWSSHEGLFVLAVGIEKVVALKDDWAIGRGDLDLPSGETKKNLTFEATGVNLSTGDRFLRMVTLRVTRGGITVFGTVRAYKENPADTTVKVDICLRRLGDTGPFSWTIATGQPIDGTGNLTLRLTGNNADLSFGAASTPSLDMGGTGDVTLCRLEIQGNPYLNARPTVNEVSAQSKD